MAPQSADLNPIENLWTDVKKAVHTYNLISNEALWMVVKKVQSGFLFSGCQYLVDSMSKRCAVVIPKKGYSTKY